jgi:hypothetical protein
MERPQRDEYVDYYHRYIERVPDGDVLEILEAQRDGFVAMIEDIDPGRGDHRYAEGKWSIKEVIGHVVDSERVFGLRALAFARGDTTPLPSFEQDEYVAGGNFADRTLADLADEFFHLRTSLIVLFRSFGEREWMRRGTASGFEFTTRAVPYILAGHVIHHRAVLERRYLAEEDE